MEKNKINILSEKILKKIFYEQTINNYSSIIKELVENSIDANSKNISIYIENYTYNFTIIDDGDGMSYNNLKKCFLKGATSKIKEEKDLINIKTIGYRGNALYYISNISMMEIITKINKNEIGYKLIIEYGKIIKIIPFFCKNGTSFSINNIFFNILNKKNFLLSNKYEYNKILNVLYKIIICYNKINFKLFHNNKLIFNFNKSNIKKRIYNIFFKKIKYKNFFYFKKKKKYKKVSIKLLLINNKIFKKKLNFIFVNKRFIINNNYYNLIKKYLLKYNKKNINFFLFLKLNNKYININILPDKTKIIFDKKIKIKKIIINFLKELINKNYFLNKKNIKKFLIFKKKKKKKKKKIYNIKDLKKKKKKLKEKIKKYFFFFLKKNILYIKYIPFFFKKKYLINFFNIIFLFFKKKKKENKINIKKILLLFFCKEKCKKKIMNKKFNIKNILLKVIKYKKFYISPKKKKIFFLIKKKKN
ncbi:MAG: DNA mismatch repair endonuclease MutL [Candidatus Shikimatogenerans bostrichidophilus]|nr:MAG: DNA mismatch repair endonuclease MutL [Candidatus Shikimatogenerans bostrichidophilus]